MLQNCVCSEKGSTLKGKAHPKWQPMNKVMYVDYNNNMKMFTMLLLLT